MTTARVFAVTLLAAGFAFSIGCGGGSSSSSTHTTTPPTTPANNSLTITVDAGPAGNYANGAFTSVTVCEPGTSTCQTVDGVLVDTGSSGLRILSSALTTVSLPQQKASDGNSVAECLTFLGSYTWGPVETADVEMAGEKASSVPIQVLSDTDYTAPNACTSSGFPPADTLDSLGANGILGVGLAAQDCGPSCPAGQYFECSSTTNCVSTNEALAQQVINPVALFASDNNGVIIEFPAVSGAEASVSGTMVFGIGTQSNNGLGSATIYDAPDGTLTTTFSGNAYPGSFLDTGSNGYFFLDSSLTGLADCNSSNSPGGAVPIGFYCPATTQNFTAANQGTNGTSGTISFSVASASTLFASSADTVFPTLGGPASNPPNYFDWGLPFFFGRNVYTAIENTSTPAGEGPYWAY